MLSTYLCLQCEGHLDDVIHEFAYLALHHNSRAVFDPTYPSIYMGAFIKTDWKSMYGNVKEMIHPYAPAPVVKTLTLVCLLI
jgi:hypothetical protein